MLPPCLVAHTARKFAVEIDSYFVRWTLQYAGLSGSTGKRTREEQHGDPPMNQLRAGFAVSGALLLGVLLGPLSAPPVHAQEDAQRATPPPGKALLFIFRSDREPRAAQVPIAVNAVHVGDLEDGTFLSVSVDPGRTFLRSG